MKRNCPNCLKKAVIEDGYCSQCRQCTLAPTPFSTVKFSKGLVHALAVCPECAWRCGDYLVAEKQARKHASKTGHKVSIELGYSGTYTV